MRTVTLFTKPGCHLCEAVEQVISDARRRRPFEFVIRDILKDPNLHARYRDALPVVMLDGREIARYRLSAAELDRALMEG